MHFPDFEIFNVHTSEHFWADCNLPETPARKPLKLSSNWEADLRAAVRDIRIEMIEQRCEEVLTIVEKQKADIAALRETCQSLTTAGLVIPISTFAPEPYELKRPISVLIQRLDDGFMASYLEANINASGDTENEALDMVKDMMLIAYDRLSAKADRDLGPAPLRQKRILMSVIAERS